jgi:hypothetical protein
VKQLLFLRMCQSFQYPMHAKLGLGGEVELVRLGAVVYSSELSCVWGGDLV